jgi:hypothetical protein
MTLQRDRHCPLAHTRTHGGRWRRPLQIGERIPRELLQTRVG